MAIIKILWMDKAEVAYDAENYGYSDDEKIFWISTKNFPEIGDRKLFNFPTVNIRVIEVNK